MTTNTANQPTLTVRQRRYLDQLDAANGCTECLLTRNGGLWTRGELNQVRASLARKAS